MSISIVALICFFAAASICCATFLVCRDLLAPGDAVTGRAISLGSRGLRRIPTVLDEVPSRSIAGRIDQSFDRLVLETGLEMTPIAALLLLIACGLMIGSCLFTYFNNPVLGFLGTAAGMLVPMLIMIVVRSRRLREMQSQMPYVLDLFARGIRAGESVDQAISLVGAETKGPLGREFTRCARQLEMGLSIPGVMQSLSRRVRLVEVRMLASTLMVHRQTGGNLPVTLERMSYVVRDRLNAQRQMRASTAAGRSASILIAAICPIVYIIMFAWQPEHVSILLDDPLGKMLLMAAIVLELIGIIWVARLIRTE